MSTITALFYKAMSWLLSMVISLTGTLSGGTVWQQQKESLDSIQKINDNCYLMDYTYQYDLDTLLNSKTGNSTSVGLLMYAAADVFLQLNPTAKKLAADMGFYLTLDDDKVSEVLCSAMQFIEQFGCTTFNALSPTGDALMGRNYDYMESPTLTVWTHPEDGYKSVSTVSLYFLNYGDDFLPDTLFTSLLTLFAPYLPVDGINEKGLSVAVLELETDETFTQTEKKDITTTAVIRTVLDHAADVDEAIEIFKSYDMHDLLAGDCTYHYQISDAKGNTAVIEYENGEPTVLRPDETGTLIATNYWLIPGIDDPLGMGQERMQAVKDGLIAKNYRVTEQEAMDLLEASHVENEDMHGYVCSTIISIVFNNTKKTLDICSMYDYDNVMHFSVDKPLEYSK